LLAEQEYGEQDKRKHKDIPPSPWGPSGERRKGKVKTTEPANNYGIEEELDAI
jgi:hypothetical protein